MIKIPNLVLSLFITLSFSIAYSQDIYNPRSISISVPVIESMRSYRNGDQPYDRTTNDSTTVFTISESPKTYEKFQVNGDSIFMTWFGEGSPFGPTVLYTMHFVIDTVNNKTNNLFIGYYANTELPGRMGSRYYTNSFMSFTSVEFLRLDDTSVIVHISGESCKNSCTNASSYLDVWEPTSLKYNLGSGTTNQTIRRRDDTSQYHCDINFQFIKSTFNSVRSSLEIKGEHFVSSISLPNKTIHFFYQPAPTEQNIFVYDVVGRIVMKIQISPQSSDTECSSSQLLAGHYFARLGNKTTNFIIY